ncbi:MAG: EamA family transporter [Gaiellaceae bacterium]
MLGLLAAIWGAAFMLIAIGLRGFEPATLIAVHTAVPFFLIAWGQQYVDSNIVVILNAAAPLFIVLLAAVAVRSERVGGLRLAGFVAGFAGVVLVVGGGPGEGGRGVVVGLAVVVAATALAFQLYFGLISGVGASRAILLTYLVPSLALVYGIMLLDEPFRWTAVAGLALVLAGVAVGTGGVRRRAVPAA